MLVEQLDAANAIVERKEKALHTLKETNALLLKQVRTRRGGRERERANGPTDRQTDRRSEEGGKEGRGRRDTGEMEIHRAGEKREGGEEGRDRGSAVKTFAVASGPVFGLSQSGVFQCSHSGL